jgi:hypothetical protein
VWWQYQEEAWGPDTLEVEESCEFEARLGYIARPSQIERRGEKKEKRGKEKGRKE